MSFVQQLIRPSPIDNGLFPHLCSPYAVFGLIVAGQLVAVAIVLVKTSLTSFSWSLLGNVSLVIQWIILLSALVLCQLSRTFLHLSVITGGCLAYATVLLIALVVIVSSQWFVDGWINPDLLLNNMALAAIFSGIFLRFLYLQQQLRNQQQAELQSRIQALHARIRPHFLFNSMNAVASLIPINPDMAEKVVEDLSELFRVSLQETGLVSLKEEVTLCLRYVNIEQIRLGGRLQVQCHCPQELHNIKVPSLILQPLVENAIYHGIQKLKKGGLVNISTWQDGQYLVIKVTNPLPNLVGNETDNLQNLFEKKQNNNMALKNIENRLQAYYGDKASVTREPAVISGESSSTEVYEVLVTIPTNPDEA